MYSTAGIFGVLGKGNISWKKRLGRPHCCKTHWWLTLTQPGGWGGGRGTWYMLPSPFTLQSKTIWRRPRAILIRNENTGFNPFQGGGGGGGAHCALPPPQVNFLKYLKNALSYRVETFWLLKWTNFQKKHFQLSPPTLGYHSNAQSWRMFSNNIFQQFSSKISPELERFLLYLWRVS